MPDAGPARACRSRPARRAPGPRRAAAGCPRASPPTTLPGACSSWSTRKARPGRRPRRRPRSRHLEDADLLGRAEPVLRGPQQAQRAERSPSRLRTASTRCSSVFGPASVPSLVTWPTRMTGDARRPWRAPSAAGRDSRTWPTLPAGPSSSSTVTVWIESTMSDAPAVPPGRSSAMRPTSLSARTSIARPPATRSEPQAAGPQADLPGRLLARSRTGRSRPRRGAGQRPGRRPGAGASTCRYPARRRAGRASPGRARRRGRGRASPIPVGDADGSASRGRRAATAARRRPRPASGAAPARPRPGSRTTRLDERVPGAAGPALPLPAEEAAPHAWQT